MDENVVDVAGRREAVLDYLRDGPTAKRDVIDVVGSSRSTVDRAIAELREAGLVVQREGRYETTLAGVLALDARRQYNREARAISRAAPALEPLWKESPVARRFVREADVTLVGESETAAPLTVLRSAVRQADTVRGTLPTAPSGSFLDTLHDAAVGSDVPVTLVCSASLFQEAVGERPAWLRRLVLDGSGRVLTGDVPDFGLLVVAGPDGPLALLQVFDEGRLHAVLQADADPAVAWATDTVDGLVEAATDATERIADLPVDATDAHAAPGPVAGRGAATVGSASDDAVPDALLGGGFAVDHAGLRTPAFGVEGACTVALWFESDGFDTDWEALVNWDALGVGYRRGWLFGHVYDREAGVKRARTEVSVDRVTPGRWHHLAYTYDGREARLHLDGEVVSRTTDDYPLSLQDTGAAVGYHDRDTGVHDATYEGRIADARFYATALDEERVRRLVRATRPTE